MMDPSLSILSGEVAAFVPRWIMSSYRPVKESPSFRINILGAFFFGPLRSFGAAASGSIKDELDEGFPTAQMVEAANS